MQSQECGFTYYTRFYRGDTQPVPMGPAVACVGTFLILTLLGDNNTWSVTLWAPNEDRALRSFKAPTVFDAVVRACPLYAHWLDGEPITGVQPMAGILDRYRRFVVDGTPVATGAVAVGDAWACTNPSAGRGISVGLRHAQRLRDTVRFLGDDDPIEFARRWDDVTETELAPWYWNQLQADRARLERIASVREGTPAAPDVGVPLPPRYADAGRAMLYDPDVFRGVMETVGCLATPQEVFSRPGLWERVNTTPGDAFEIPGPSRAELLELVGT